MIWLMPKSGTNGALYPKNGAGGIDVVLQFDPKRLESFWEEIYHIQLGHHRELGSGLSYKRKWEMEKEVAELKLKIGEVSPDEAIMCLYNVRQSLIDSADEASQIEGEDRICLSWPFFLSQVEEVVGFSQAHIKSYIESQTKGGGVN